MEQKAERFSIPSSDGVHQLACYLIRPEGKPKAVLQICHGMCEYFLNYQALIAAMTARGYLVAGHDHLGHGDTANEGELGFFGTEHGVDFLVEDTAAVTRKLRADFPDLPLFLLGHSMGSFITRVYMMRFPHLTDGIILSGTCGTNAALPVAKAVARHIIKKGNARAPQPAVSNLAFSGYNKRCKPRRTEFDWLSTDLSVGEAYEKDEKRNFIFTGYGFRDIFDLMGLIMARSWAYSVSKTDPLLLVAGRQDPVGSYGKGVEKTYNRLKKAGLEDVSLILYDHSRHEPHNDADALREQEDLDRWMEQRMHKS